MTLARHVRFAALAALVAGFALAGCVSPPNWWHPGPEAYQQRRAEKTDPYPAVDVGPEVVGGRPRTYDRPATEPKRIQTNNPRAAARVPPPWTVVP
jgi:hypothetical protein